MIRTSNGRTFRTADTSYSMSQKSARRAHGFTSTEWISPQRRRPLPARLRHEPERKASSQRQNLRKNAQMHHRLPRFESSSRDSREVFR